MDRTIVGLPASPGIVVGHVHLLRWEVPEVRHRIVADDHIEAEIARGCRLLYLESPTNPPLKVLDIAAGILFAKVLNRLSGGTFNPLIGAAGISAFPMAARVVQKVAHDEDFENYPLMHAMGANAAGQVASVVAGGVLLAFVERVQSTAGGSGSGSSGRR